jgi:hypothetical protein
LAWPTTVLQLLELIGITGLAFTEPVISILDRGAPYLASFRLRRADFVLSIVIVAFGPALGAFAIAQLARLVGDGLSAVVHAIFLGVFTGLFVNSVAKHGARLRIRYQFVLLVLTSAISALLYWQFVNLERVLIALMPLAIVVVIRFLSSKRLDKILVQWAAEDEPVTVTQPHRVVMIVFDELPLMSLLDGAGGIDDAFPNFQRLANEAHWLRNTTSMSASTRRAVPAIMTGRFPRRGLFPTTRDHPRSVFSMLEGTYRLNVHESLTQVAAVSSASTVTGWRALTGEAFRLGYRYSSPLHDEKDKFGGQTPDQYFGDRRLFRNPLTAGERFLETLVPSDEPVLDFLHMLLPHRPWHYCGAGRHYGAPRVEGVVDDKCLSDEAVRAGRQRHLLQLQATDWFLGQIVERLRAIDAYDDALMIVVADHGVSLRKDEPQRAVTPGNYEELLWVPLFIKAPHQREGVVDDRASMTLDILPTIAEHLGIALSWDIEGTRASQPPPDGRERVGRVVLPAGGSLADIDAAGEQVLFARADGFASVMASQAVRDHERGPYGFFQAGPLGGCVGNAVADVEKVAEASLAASVAVHRSFHAVERDAQKIPWVYVEGDVRGQRGDCSEVVFALNGRIAGATALRTVGAQRARFQAMLAPDLFENGSNNLEMFAVRTAATGPALAPIQVQLTERQGS